mmetsp:Transcript_12019/g.34360  ORF Transcript_12019/g.34360 Transcript_12019/m.34360 type:complete len:207 (+) Transcript_12019:244-864(+)
MEVRPRPLQDGGEPPGGDDQEPRRHHHGGRPRHLRPHRGHHHRRAHHGARQRRGLQHLLPIQRLGSRRSRAHVRAVLPGRRRDHRHDRRDRRHCHRPPGRGQHGPNVPIDAQRQGRRWGRGRRCRRCARHQRRHGRREQIVCRYAHYAHFLRGLGIVWFDCGAHCESGIVFLWRVTMMNESPKKKLRKNKKRQVRSELQQWLGWCQ